MAQKQSQKAEGMEAAEGVEEVLPEIVRNTQTLSDADVAAYLGEGFQSVVSRALSSSEVLGQPTLLARDDKSFLIGLDMILLGWRFNPGEFNDEFASVMVMTEGDQYFVFNDSSTGVYRQLKEITDRIGKQYGPIRVAHGLRASDYWLDEQTGRTYTVKPDDMKTIPARTYYLT